MAVCEVRVPTYQRPDLLRRALESLISQTHTQWYSFIFDDSPSQEGKAVVDALQDSRLIYEPHSENIGRSRNIDHCFRSDAYRGDASYAFVLEDDNYLFPEFIEKNIQALEKNNMSVLLRNQEVRIETDGKSTSTNRTTRGQWFSQGTYTPIELYSRLFFCEGISNGGLFWNTEKIISNLQVGSQVKHSWHQELFRTLNVQENILFENTPLCVFTEFEYHPKMINFSPKHNRATQSIQIHLLTKYKEEIIQEAKQVASTEEKEALLEKKLLNALYLKYSFTQISEISRLRILLKSLIRYLFYQDPFADILSA